MPMPPPIRPAGPPDPPPVDVVLPGDRAYWLRRGRLQLRQAEDAAGRAGRPALHRIVDRASEEMRAIANRLSVGKIDVAEWYTQSMDSLVGRQYAGVMAMTRHGNPGPEALDAIDRLIARQAGFLTRFRNQLARGLDLSAKAMAARAARYGLAIWSTAIAVDRMQHADKAAQERRVLDDGVYRHCATCPGLAALGWQPAGALPEIGDGECGTSCRCWFQYK